MKLLVGKIEPIGSTLVALVDSKSPADQHGYSRLRSFIKFHNVTNIVCKSDQERSLVAAIEAVARSQVAQAGGLPSGP